MRERIESLRFWAGLLSLLAILSICGGALFAVAVANRDGILAFAGLASSLTQSVVLFGLAALCGGLADLLQQPGQKPGRKIVSDDDFEDEMKSRLRDLA